MSVSKKAECTGESLLMSMMNGQDKDLVFLALCVEKMVQFCAQPHIKHQKPARKVLYGDMSMTITHKIILDSLELCMQRDHNGICNL